MAIDFEFKTIDDNVYITNYLGNKEIVEIPVTDDDGNIIYGIKSFSFVDKNVELLYIPVSVKDIEENAFVGCIELREVYFVKNHNEKQYVFCDYNQCINLEDVFVDGRNDICIFTGQKSVVLNKDSEKFLYFSDICYDYIFEEKNKMCNFIGDNYHGIYEITELPDTASCYIPDYYNGYKVIVRLDTTITARYTRIYHLRVPYDTIFGDVDFEITRLLCFGKKLGSKMFQHLPTQIENLVSLTIEEGTEAISVWNNMSPQLRKLKHIQLPNSLIKFNSFCIFKSPFFNELFDKCKKTRKDGFIVYQNILMGRYFCNNDVIIPDDVKIISRGFFNSGCIDTLKIGKNVRHVDYGCFDGEIKKIIIPENVLYIEKQAFILNQEEKECEIVIDKEKTFLEEKAFDFSGWLPFY